MLLRPLTLLASVLTSLTTVTSAASITFAISPTHLLPNPSTLTASTRATLFRHSHTYSVPLTRRNTFEFRNVSSGSYLFTVQARDHTFPPLRVDVTSQQEGAGAGEKAEVYQTFWGNEWGNKGEYRGGGAGEATIQIQAESVKNFYQERQGFDPVSFLKSPMILMALVSLVLIVGIPWLTDSMDDETRAEFEEMSKKSPLTQAGAAVGKSPLENFDLAGWMAGKTVGKGAESTESKEN